MPCRGSKPAYQPACTVSPTPRPHRSNKTDLTSAVVWVPDDNLRALFPDEDHGAAHVISSLEEWRPEEWGLPALSVSRLEQDESRRRGDEKTRRRGELVTNLG